MSRPAPVDELASCLAQLRRHIETLLDSDQLLPAEGHALLEMLRQAQERAGVGDRAEAGGLLLGLETLLRALLDTGVLDPDAGDLCLVTARAASVSLSQTSQ